MSDDLLHDAANAQTPAARAFERAVPTPWNGLVLQPLTPRILIAAQACGLRVLNIGATGPDGAYDGAFWDAIITGYLCTSPVSTTLLAVRKPSEVMEAALKWADDLRLDLASPAFHALATIFAERLGDIAASMTEPVNKDGDLAGQKKTQEQGSTGSSSLESRSSPSPAETPNTSS